LRDARPEHLALINAKKQIAGYKLSLALGSCKESLIVRGLVAQNIESKSDPKAA
jgi:hypothetical protein